MPSDSESERPDRTNTLGEIIDTLPLTRVHYVALALVVLGGMFEVFEQIILSALGPSLQDALGVDAGGIALLSTATLLAIVVGGILGGYLADRFGRRSVLAVSIGIYCAGSIFAALSPNYAVLILARIVTGFGVGGEIAVGLTYLSELSPTKVRGVFVSLFNTISAGVGIFLVFVYTLFVLGPFASLVGAGADAWRWAFGLLALPAVLIFFFRRYLPETPAYLLHKGDVVGTNAALNRLATGRFRPAPEAENHDYVTSETKRLSESAHSSDGGNPLGAILGRKLRTRTVALGGCAFLAWGAQFSIILIMPLLLVQRGYSIAGSLTFTMVQNLGVLAGSIFASYGGFAVPRKWMVRIGALGAGLAIIAFALFAQGIALILILGFVFQFFVMMVNTTIWTWSPELFPTSLRGLGTAVIVNIGFLGGAILPLGTAAFFQSMGSGPAFVAVAAMYALIVLIVKAVPETHQVPLEVLHGSSADYQPGEAIAAPAVVHPERNYIHD